MSNDYISVSLGSGSMVKIVAEEGYQLKREGDTVIMSEKPPRYTLKLGMYSQHFHDTKTGHAVPLDKVLEILNAWDKEHR